MSTPQDRHIFLTLIDSAIMAAWGSHCKDQEAQALFEDATRLGRMIDEFKGKQSRAYINTLEFMQESTLKLHSMALHSAYGFKGQYSAYQAIRKYMARQGYRFV